MFRPLLEELLTLILKDATFWTLLWEGFLTQTAFAIRVIRDTPRFAAYAPKTETLILKIPKSHKSQFRKLILAQPSPSPKPAQPS